MGLNSSTFKLPYRRNNFFTGREQTLRTLHKTLMKASAAALTQAQAISGLGGIGKTQTALEYAYRYRKTYRFVLWARAESHLALRTDFVELASILDLPEKTARNPDEAVQAVVRWLETNSDWLLIFDNADDPELVKNFLPFAPKGHILLTSRAQVFHSLGIKSSIEMNEMTPQDAVEFLFKRTGRNDNNPAVKNAVKQLVRELGYLPLALEQAGAFIAENSVRFQDYLISYRKQRLKLLEQSKPIAGSYNDSVFTTWAMNFRQVRRTSKAAADLLRASAFLSPDSIPLELITRGYSKLGPVLSIKLANVDDVPVVLDKTLRPLTRYSLIRRDINSHTYSIHRLVQEVLKHEMGDSTRRRWALIAIRTLNQAFPSTLFKDWPLCDRLLIQAKAGARLVSEWGFRFKEAAQLLNRAGFYCYERAQYDEAEPLLRLALIIREKVAGPNHIDVAFSLNDLAEVYRTQGRYAEAKSLYERALLIRENARKPDPPRIARSLVNLAHIYVAQGNYGAAEPLYRRALKLREEALGPMHPDVAASLNSLGFLYYAQGKYAESQPLHERALNIRENAPEPDPPRLARTMNNLALLYGAQGKYSEAERLHKRALTSREKALGPMHPDVAASLNNLALLYYTQGKYAEAGRLQKRALAIREKVLGPNHHDTATSLNNLALLYTAQGKYKEAKSLHERSLQTRQKALGSNHPYLAYSINNLGILHQKLGEYDKAARLHKRALKLREKALGSGHPEVAFSLNNLALAYDAQGKYAEAQPLYERALAIRNSVLGPNHPDTATSRKHYRDLLRKSGAAKKRDKA